MRVLTAAQTELIADRAQALGDGTRVRIIAALSRGETSVGQIAALVKARESTVSKHLQVLHRAGFVRRHREASTVIYRLSSPALLSWLLCIAGTRFRPAALKMGPRRRRP
jgi:DNA-binding transcriptional ArsR family regulator